MAKRVAIQDAALADIHPTLAEEQLHGPSNADCNPWSAVAFAPG